MQPRDIDALVAEKAFGQVPCDSWKQVNFGSAGGPALMKECQHKDGACYPTTEIGSIHGTIGGPGQYTSSPIWSKQLRDRMRELGWQYTLGGADGQPYIAKFWKENGGDWLVDRSDTEEMAVAMAALKALGAEI